MLIGQRKPLTAAQQFLNLRANPVSAGTGDLRAGKFTWRFVARPLPLSREYDVRIEFAQRRAPEVYVDAPDLSLLAGDRRIPHLYSRRRLQLCLYLPRIFEWESWMRLDQTIVPWAILWLLYFEEWLLTDDWKGGGEHPKSEDVDRVEAA